MKIAVLVKHVPDTWAERSIDPATGRIDRRGVDQVIDEISERAVEAALVSAERHTGSEVIAVTMGPEAARDALKKALSMGCASGMHIVDDALGGADVLQTARVLAAAIGPLDVDLVIAGDTSTDGNTGMLPAALAEALGATPLTRVDTLVTEEGEVFGTRRVREGVAHLRATLPAVVSITEKMPDARFPNFRSIMAAKKKPVAVRRLAELGVDAGAPRSEVVSVVPSPPRAAGVTIVDDGTAADQLVAYLVDKRLV